MLEPGAGSGNIIKTLQKYGDFSIDAVEIRPEEAQHLQDLGVNVIIDDFLSMDLGKKYDLIIGNPPFNQAIEFVEKSLGLLKSGGRLIFLLRTAFMESDQRFEFWQQEDHGSPDFTPYISARALPDTERTPRVTRGSYGSPAAVARQ